jgi:hypothetical protein
LKLTAKDAKDVKDAEGASLFNHRRKKNFNRRWTQINADTGIAGGSLSGGLCWLVFVSIGF